ncbi:fumarylacetoacetate hydrolase family protein [Tamlana sp. 2201CG12-4]|uniref:fumarylacetoacetate hydrolase family protein n=1 Tax=Tamlana sp. 2201CG12-4 TaxID=3112582 RepID=UPI002DBA249C|nr:fumarylacetoacetate hydrolase family protein [Tamlana sp. 2201CG12-4]MEC3908493.1 fumarylacetoacetate hydrolase family protein [Tamlana sp. 2201CG12-4]
MKIYKQGTSVYVDYLEKRYLFENVNWDAFINRENLRSTIINTIEKNQYTKAEVIDDIKFIPEAPIGSQEIWASGVTYLRSKEARMEESKKSGGDTFYDKVYDAERPELFFKAMANRVVGTHDTVNIRKDSTWNVPEPELTLFITSEGTIEGYTIGNDVSSRSIEGENPLYLPQAKVYERCAGLGPCIYLPEDGISSDALIRLRIERNGEEVFNGQVGINQMKRSHQELVEFLYRECDFPHGSFLMTGTGLVPPDEFTLEVGDIVHITITSIGTLTNTIALKN